MLIVIDYYAENPIVGKTLQSCYLENSNVYDDINGNGDSDWTIYNSTTLSIESGTVNIDGVNSNINWGWGVPPGIYSPGNSVKIGAENIYMGNPSNTSGNSVNFLSANQVKIPGGLNGQVLTTDGSSNLSWDDATINVSTNNVLLGRATIGAGSAEEISIGSGLTLTGTTLSASGGGGGGYQRQVDYFTTSGAWSKPAWATYITVLLLPGGGGGGSGRRGATTTVRCGGAGGGSCSYTSVENIDATSLAFLESVVVGSGGIGGASVTTDDTNGNTGGAGGLSSFGSLIATGNNGGGQGGGTSSTSTGGLGFGSSSQTLASGSGVDGRNGTNGNGQSLITALLSLANGTLPGAGGAGAPALGTATAIGGQCSSSNWLIIRPSLGITFGVSGTGGGNGGDGNSYLNAELYINTSGGGGSYKTGQATGNGGSALGYGAGGGGGAGSDNGFNSGAGGNGGNGLVIVISEG